MFPLPDGATDTHVHVFDPLRFPFAADAAYVPAPAEVGTVEDLAAVLDCAGIRRVVLVNPTSGYGIDNRCMLAALQTLGARARGIARVPLDIDDAALDALARQNVVGVRVDFIGAGSAALADARLPRLLARLADRGLVCVMQGERAQWVDIAPIVAGTPVRVVVDHCGRPDVAAGVGSPAFAALLRLAETGRVAVKLSGPMRFSLRPPPFEDTDPFYAAVVRTFGPDALMWGSDWPFLRSDRRFDYGPSLAHLARVVPDAAARDRILSATPARWFGFLL